MEYAKKSLDVFSEGSLSKCVQIFPGWTQNSRPFRILNHDRSIKKGIMANSLAQLQNKVREVFQTGCTGSLVLNEDGTSVETQEFFGTLKDNTVFMLLEDGQMWSPQQTKPTEDATGRNQPRKDLAKLTIDFYKRKPEDFLGCVKVQAALYGIYTLSYELQCYKAKRIIREALKWTLFSLHTTGHVLVGVSSYIQHLIDEEEKKEAQQSRPVSTIKQLMYR